MVRDSHGLIRGQGWTGMRQVETLAKHKSSVTLPEDTTGPPPHVPSNESQLMSPTINPTLL